MDKDKRTGLLQLVLVIAFILGSVALSKMLEISYEPPVQNNTADRVLVVETTRVGPEPYRISFDMTGLVQARNNIRIVPQVSGRVTSIHEGFYPGGSFHQGDVLFEIESEDYQYNVMRLDAEVARAGTALELAAAESQAATDEWKLVNGDEPVPDLVAKRPQLAEARAILQSAEAQLDDARLDLERTRFSLPFSGRVLSSDIAVGQFVNAGQVYGTVFDSSSLEISASLMDRQLEWLLQADDPEITITATYLGKEHVYPGRINRPASSLESSTRFATVYFGFEEVVTGLLPGVFARINIKGNVLDGITVLPLSALQARNIVWEVAGDNSLVRLEPEIIYQDEGHVAVRGLQGPREIVASRIAGATDGMRVRVTDGPAAGTVTE